MRGFGVGDGMVNPCLGVKFYEFVDDFKYNSEIVLIFIQIA
jgi:hypothetical protein